MDDSLGKNSKSCLSLSLSLACLLGVLGVADNPLARRPTPLGSLRSDSLFVAFSMAAILGITLRMERNHDL